MVQGSKALQRVGNSSCLLAHGRSRSRRVAFKGGGSTIVPSVHPRDSRLLNSLHNRWNSSLLSVKNQSASTFNHVKMYLLIIVLPLLGGLFAGGFGRLLGSRGAALVATCSVVITALLSGVAFYEIALSATTCHLRLGPWFVSEMFDGRWGFYCVACL